MEEEPQVQKYRATKKVVLSICAGRIENHRIQKEKVRCQAR